MLIVLEIGLFVLDLDLITGSQQFGARAQDRRGDWHWHRGSLLDGSVADRLHGGFADRCHGQREPVGRAALLLEITLLASGGALGCLVAYISSSGRFRQVRGQGLPLGGRVPPVACQCLGRISPPPSGAESPIARTTRRRKTRRRKTAPAPPEKARLARMTMTRTRRKKGAGPAEEHPLARTTMTRTERSENHGPAAPESFQTLVAAGKW